MSKFVKIGRISYLREPLVLEKHENVDLNSCSIDISCGGKIGHLRCAVYYPEYDLNPKRGAVGLFVDGTDDPFFLLKFMPKKQEQGTFHLGSDLVSQQSEISLPIVNGKNLSTVYGSWKSHPLRISAHSMGIARGFNEKIHRRRAI